MDKTITWQSCNLFYRVEGKGNPVVLIHGFAEDGRIWNEQVAFLKNDFLVIIPDLPGSGRSGSLENLAGKPTMDSFAEAIKAILDAEKVMICTVIGHSMGGYITLALAEKYPDRLAACSLFHSTAYADDMDKMQVRKKGIGFIQTHGSAAFIRQSIPNLFSPLTRKQSPEMIEQLIRRYDNFSADSLVSYYEAMILRPDRTSVLAKFAGPVLFICGGNDQAVPLEHSLQQCHIPDLSYIHILENTGHLGMLEATNTINQLLWGFIKNVGYDS